jgi:hypothetical protein
MFSTKGTILYFAILILSIIFAISIGLSLIIFGQLKMQREIGYSVIALCAADTGVERALYAIYKDGNLSFSESANLDNGASYNVFVSTSSTQCGTSVRYYCIKSRGTFKETTRSIDASF